MSETFRQELLAEFRAEADASGEYLQSVFFDAVVREMEDVGSTGEVQSAYFRSDRPFVCLDGIAIDSVESRLDLLVLDLRDTSDELPTLNRTEMQRFLQGLDRFRKLACTQGLESRLETTSPEYDAALRIADMVEQGASTRFIIITDAALSERIRDLEDFEMADGNSARVSVWDINRIASVMGPSGVDNIEIDFREYAGGGLACLPAHVNDEEYESYLAVVPGNVLADIYGTHGARLLEQNVRSFLQARGKVNKGIRKSLHDEPQMFFAYNNGITATAEAVTIEHGDGGEKIRAVRNLQIVNGGQTTASIFTSRAKDNISLDRVFVQMKLAVIPAVTVETIVPNISRYANTQNKVSDADLFSNHPFHVRLEEFSRRIWAPPAPGAASQTKWFYERARGQYADARARLSPSQRKRFDREHPKKQMFTKTDLAKYEMIWRQAPQVVSLGAQKNFAQFADTVVLEWWNEADGAFDVGYWRSVVAKALIFRVTENLVSKAQWYERGYRANIVAYGLGLIAKEISDSKLTLNFDRIYNEQAVPQVLLEAINAACESAQTVLLNPAEGIRNISEWAKRPECWARFRNIKIDVRGMHGLLTEGGMC